MWKKMGEFAKGVSEDTGGGLFVCVVVAAFALVIVGLTLDLVQYLLPNPVTRFLLRGVRWAAGDNVFWLGVLAITLLIGLAGRWLYHREARSRPGG